MARKAELDTLQHEALKLGYQELVRRITESLEVNPSVRNVLEDRIKEIQKRLKELEGCE